MLEQRLHLIRLVEAGELSFTACCAAVGLSRTAGYQWVERYACDGASGLLDRPRARLTQPQAAPLAVRQLVWELRARYGWGARKLQRLLADRHGIDLAASTIGSYLRAMGLTHPTTGKPAGWAGSTTRTLATAPNEVWTLDGKGWFRTGCGTRCEPLTVLDDASRYALACVSLDGLTTRTVRAALTHCFRAYGLPQVIRTDNGAPFASTAWTRISQLQVWWLKLGIHAEQIPPGQPTANGRHERFHRTLKAGCCTPPAATRAQQQRRFTKFLAEYNTVRPHEALGQTPPADHYTLSPRPYPARLPELRYPPDCVMRRIRSNGEFRWHGETYFLSEALIGEAVGFLPLDERWYRVYIGPRPLCLWDGLRCQTRPLAPLEGGQSPEARR